MRRVRSATRQGADAGFTMLELIVSMAIMTVFMGMFSGAVYEIYHTADNTQALANANAQLNQAFQRLDTLVRYAGYVSKPGYDGADGDPDWYVEFADSPRPLQSRTDVPQTCYQLRIHTYPGEDTGRLELRSWDANGLTAWKQIASNITNGDAAAGSDTQPFSYAKPDYGPPAVMTGTNRSGALTINLVASDGGGSSKQTTSSKITITAVNTYVGTPTAGLCPRSGPS